jgi:hypothetical protein
MRLAACLKGDGIDERATAQLGDINDKLKATLFMFVLESVKGWARFIPFYRQNIVLVDR